MQPIHSIAETTGEPLVIEPCRKLTGTIALFGPGSGAALVTVVGVLVEVPVMLSVCSICNWTRNWFPQRAIEPLP